MKCGSILKTGAILSSKGRHNPEHHTNVVPCFSRPWSIGLLKTVWCVRKHACQVSVFCNHYFDKRDISMFLQVRVLCQERNVYLLIFPPCGAFSSVTCSNIFHFNQLYVSLSFFRPLALSSILDVFMERRRGLKRSRERGIAVLAFLLNPPYTEDSEKHNFKLILVQISKTRPSQCSG